MNDRLITRRDFARTSLAAAAGASLTSAATLRAKPRSSRVVIVREEAVLDNAHKVNKAILQKMLDQTVMAVTGGNAAADGWKAIAAVKDKVGLVPTPHLNPTHPELIELVASSLQNPAGLPAERIVNAQGRNLEIVKSCTVLIALPALKAHWLTGIGTVLKNYIMFSGNPQAYHDSRNVKLGEIWKLPEVEGKTKLVLVDALYPLCDKGPQPDPRYKWHYNGLIAGTDPVAVETVCLNIITKKRELIKGEPWPLTPPPLCVEAADKLYGLGTSSMDEISLERIGWRKELLV